jgi:hypothetical protein
MALQDLLQAPSVWSHFVGTSCLPNLLHGFEVDIEQLMPEPKGRNLGKDLWLEFLARWKERLWRLLHWMLEVFFVRKAPCIA